MKNSAPQKDNVGDNEYDGYREWKQWNNLFEPLPHEKNLFFGEFKNIPFNGKQFLDIGFGSGALLGWARSQGAIIAGIELQEELRKAAEDNGILTYSDLDSVPSERFEIVTAFDVLEHIPRELLINFMQQVCRISAPNSYIIFRVPNCQSAAGLINQFGDSTHVTMLSGPIIEQLCKKAGLEVLAVREALDISSSAYFHQLLRPLRSVLRHLSKIFFRLVWSNSSAPRTSNVIVVAQKPAIRYS